MSDGIDGTVGVRQAFEPDRLIDNEVVTNDQGQQVYRQKVGLPDLKSRFYRLLNQVVPDGDEMRTDFGPADLYFGQAPDGTAETAASWAVLRIYLTAGSPVRWRTRAGVRWDLRTLGWS